MEKDLQLGLLDRGVLVYSLRNAWGASFLGELVSYLHISIHKLLLLLGIVVCKGFQLGCWWR